MPAPTCIAFGRSRAIASAIVDMLPNLFSTRAILGLPYSSEELREALSIVEPPTEILLVGGAFSEAEAAEAGQVLAAYRKEIGAPGSGFCMRVPPHFMEDNPREVGMKLVVEWVREQCAGQGITDEVCALLTQYVEVS